ncbi:hypothetical protein KEJ18_01840 [Candidatus Bathyarchaeota archaeon]|nr:hypothetical protein [Candidatus Bathyarchaeota archaeon]
MSAKDSLLGKQARAIVENKDEIHDLRMLLDDLNVLAKEHSIQGATRTYVTLRNCVELYFIVLKSSYENQDKNE